MLEEELKRKQQQPEKPYEITKETPPIRELTKEKVTLKKINIKLKKIKNLNIVMQCSCMDNHEKLIKE